MHSSRMRTARSLYGGGSLSKGGLCPVGVCVQGRISVQWGLCPGEGISVQGVCVQGGLCPGGFFVQGGLCPGEVSVQGRSLPRGGLCPWGSLFGGVSVQGGLPDRDPPPPVNRITDTCKNITLPQLCCGR